jgi:UDP-N-acetylglucosamine 2-epimerase (non-hydrolysing)
MKRLEPVLEELRPDLVLVVGDVNSTMAAALTSVKIGIPVAHVEAGLRSFDRSMPEEINRIVTDAISDLLFVTEESGRLNLVREGIAPERIYLVGNVMIDALEASRSRWERSGVFESYGIRATEPYALVTLHRPANVDDAETLRAFLEAMDELARHIPIIFPVHPRVSKRLGVLESGRRGSVSKRIMYLPPLGYLDFIGLMSRARVVMTDSGGVQEETTVLGVPCLTLRDTTERPVTVSHGTNRVIGADPRRIVEEALTALRRPAMRPDRPPLWDGQAAERIIGVLRDYCHHRTDRIDHEGGVNIASPSVLQPSAVRT